MKQAEKVSSIRSFLKIGHKTTVADESVKPKSSSLEGLIYLAEDKDLEILIDIMFPAKKKNNQSGE